MRRILYSKDVDALLIELSDKGIDHAEEAGQIIVHFSAQGEPVLPEILEARDLLLALLSTVVAEERASEA
ncbi:MAG: DUF2283 domain-containing protein [Desulfotomaculales bacterium]